MTHRNSRQRRIMVSLVSLSLSSQPVRLLPSLFNLHTDSVGMLKRAKGDPTWFLGSVGSRPEIMRRSDFLRVQTMMKPPRDQLACCLSMCQGFRAGEVVVSQLGDFDVDGGVVYCRDSKDHRIYPLPMAQATAYAFTKLESPDPDVYVLGRHPRFSRWGHRPVTVVSYIDRVKRWAREAGAKDWQRWHPTLLRAFFAKEWARQGGDITLLSKLLRHHSPFTTWIYLKRFVYVEDLRREMERLRRPRPSMEVESYEFRR